MSKSALRWIIIVLTAVTSVIHLVLGASSLAGGDAGFGILFILNGLGYLGLLTALFLDIAFLAERRTLAAYLMIAFTALTFILYFVFNGFTFGVMAAVSKLAELLLIIALFMYLPQRSQAM